MINYIHLTSKFEKRLNKLRHSEKMAVSAAKKADAIISNIIKNGEFPLSVLGKFTKHGEFRIKNCIKFDLGKGHRLVCVKEECRLFMLFVGTHDDCNAWIENNRNYTPDLLNKNFITYKVSGEAKSKLNAKDEIYIESDYEDILQGKLTEKDLKHVFRGLIESI